VKKTRQIKKLVRVCDSIKSERALLPVLVRRVARIAAWLLLATITFATLGPAQERPQTSLGHNLEHILAFALLGVAFGLGYADRWLGVIVAAIPVIGLLEVMQLWAPGRHARLEDFVVNIVAFWAAFALALLLARTRGQPSRPAVDS
jgi:VanZ family protein